MDSTANKKISKEILVGKIGAPHGVKGQLRVFSYTEPKENILEYQPWCFKRHGQEIPLQVTKTQPGSESILVQFAGINDRDAAAQLTHVEIFVNRDQLPSLAPDEYYWSDLEGITVVNLDGFVFGRITHLLFTGANDVMFIKGEREYCIPYIPESVVHKVDLTKQEMLVDWPAEI